MKANSARKVLSTAPVSQLLTVTCTRRSLRGRCESERPPTEPWRLILTLETACRRKQVLLLDRRLQSVLNFLM